MLENRGARLAFAAWNDGGGRRAGVSEGEIMALCGWKMQAMFDRYNIIDEANLAHSLAKRFGNGIQTVNMGCRGRRE